MARAALKKVTTYLGVDDWRQLKKLSASQNTSMAHMLRIGVRRLCVSAAQKEADVFAALDNMRKTIQKKGVSSDQLMRWSVQAQRELRHERHKK